MGRGSTRSHVYSQEKVNRRPPTISSNDDPFCMQHAVVKSSSCRGSMGKRSPPRPISRHASSRPQAIRARGALHLPLGFAWKPSPSAPWARGLPSASWTWGYPILPACSPPRVSINGLAWSSFNNNTSRPSRGVKPCEADDAETPEGVGLLRRAPEGWRDLCSYLMRLS